MDEDRLQILRMVEAGRIGADEAAQLLASLHRAESEETEDSPAAGPVAEPFPLPGKRWARFWIYPMLVGGTVLILGSLLMGLVYIAGAAGIWLICGWPMLLLGLLVVVLSLWSRSTTWLHLRISESGERKIALSFPLPLTLAAWVLRLAQPYVPQLRDTGVDEVIIALRDSASQGQPLFVDVKDDEKGEHVQVYIG